MRNKTIFKLEALKFTRSQSNDNSGAIGVVRTSDFYLLKSADDVPAYINKILKYAEYDLIYGFILSEYPFGCSIDKGASRSFRNYDWNGNLVEQSSVSSIFEDMNKRFGVNFGRDAEDCRFKLGDCVEYLEESDNTWLVKKGIIAKLPMPKEECRQVIEHAGFSLDDDQFDLMICDYLTDVYAILSDSPDGAKRRFSEAHLIFPLSAPLTDEEEARYKAIYNEFKGSNQDTYCF